MGPKSGRKFRPDLGTSLDKSGRKLFDPSIVLAMDSYASYVTREKLIFTLTNQLEPAYGEINSASVSAIPHYAPSPIACQTTLNYRQQ